MGVSHPRGTIALMSEDGPPPKTAEMPAGMQPAAQLQGFDQVIDVHGTLAFACEEVQVDGEGRPSDERKHLNEPMRWKFEPYLCLVRRRTSIGRDDLDDHGIDSPEVLDLIDDKTMVHEAVEPADDAPIRDAQNPREIVHLQRHEPGALPQGLRHEEKKRFVPPDAFDDDEERTKVGADGGEPFGRLRSRRQESQPRVVL